MDTTELKRMIDHADLLMERVYLLQDNTELIKLNIDLIRTGELDSSEKKSTEYDIKEEIDDIDKEINGIEKMLQYLKRYDRISGLKQTLEVEEFLKSIRQGLVPMESLKKESEKLTNNTRDVLYEIKLMAKEIRGSLSEEELGELVSIIRDYRHTKKDWDSLLGKPDVSISSYSPIASKLLDVTERIKNIDYSRKIDTDLSNSENKLEHILKGESENSRSDMVESVRDLRELLDRMMKQFGVNEQMVAVTTKISEIEKTKESISTVKVPKNVELLENLYNLNEDKLRAKSKTDWPVKEPYDVLQNIQRDFIKYLFSTSSAELGELPVEDQEIYLKLGSLTLGLKKHIANPHLNELQVATIDEFSHSFEAYLKRKIEIIVPNYFARRGTQS